MASHDSTCTSNTQLLNCKQYANKPNQQTATQQAAARVTVTRVLLVASRVVTQILHTTHAQARVVGTDLC